MQKLKKIIIIIQHNLQKLLHQNYSKRKKKSKIVMCMCVCV
jgi:hypothetical protein